jgi:dinuclear metal center YbgI/SA1388 family protein
MSSLSQIATYLDSYLRIREVPDHPNAHNGLQVENSGAVNLIVTAVDLSQATVDRVVERVRAGSGPALLIVHHGMFWDGVAGVTGRRYRRLKALLDHDVALYGAHIPLDVHPEVGNNAVLARELGITETSWFSDYRGIPLGLFGSLSLPIAALVERVNQLLRAESRLIAGGPQSTTRVGVITGAAGDRIHSAREAGCDTFISGEGMHHTYFDAIEFGVNVIYAGHYATEQVGVRALGHHLSERFGLPWEFHDHPTGM